MSDDDDALSRANKFLAVVPGREVARIDNDVIADLLKQAEETARPKESPRPVMVKSWAAPVTEPIPEPPRNPPPAIVAQPTPALVESSQAPAVTPEILSPAAPPVAQEGAAAQNTTVVVNVTAPAVPWWGYWGPYYYPPPPVCPVCLHPRVAFCRRWRCPLS
jgi:hypothetical protein